MNIKFEYLYRDAGNYKNWGEVIFSNTGNIPIEQINDRISSHLIDHQYFVASDLKVPDLHFEEVDASLDHGWHEFDRCSITEEGATDIHNRDISDLIEILGLIGYS